MTKLKCFNLIDVKVCKLNWDINNKILPLSTTSLDNIFFNGIMT